MELQELRNLADLARIKFSDEELTLIGADFASILGYVDQINQVNITDVAPTEHQVNVARVDVAGNTSGQYRDVMIGDAPASQDGFYKVAKIL